MADKRVSELPASTVVNDDDLWLLEQGGIAKNMSGALLLEYLEPLLQEKAEAMVSALPVTTDLDFSGWESGEIVETLNDGTEKVHAIVFDDYGVPTKIGDVTVTISEVE